MRGSAGLALLRLSAVSSLLLNLVVATLASAQSVDVQPLLSARECHVLVPVQGQIFGGLISGGLLAWDRSSPADYRRWTTKDGLSANLVTDIAYTGRFLWIATEGGGLTRAALSESGLDFRQFTSTLGGLQLTSVAGTLRGDNEVVFYGIEEGGVGIINEGLVGIVYTREDHGLIDNRVTDLAFFQGDLWVGTQAGVSLFAENLFSDQVTGLPALEITALHASGDTLLLAGTTAGVARWDAGAGQWQALTGLSGSIQDLAVDANGVWALRSGNTSDNRLWRYAAGSWQTTDLPLPHSRALAFADELWVSGRYHPMWADPTVGNAFLARRSGDSWQSWFTEETLLLGVDGVDFGADGTVWLGSRTGDAVARYDGSGWFHIDRLATAENDSSGLFNFGGNMLDLAVLPEGEVWFSQFNSGGIVRYIPAGASGGQSDDYDHLTPANSGLSGTFIIRIIPHPDGPILFLSDRHGADLLLQPAQWRDPAQWIHLPTSLIGGQTIRDAALASPDVIWFAVEDVGVVRWDVNGTAGPEAALTWQNPADDQWETIVGAPETSYVFGATQSLAVDGDGNVWAGGPGLLQFRYDPDFGTVSALNYFTEKLDAFQEGLLRNRVVDLAVDINGDIWAAQDAGLNRISTQNGEVSIDAYTDLTSYFGFGFGLLYSSGIITSLPGGQVYKVVADSASRRVLVGADRGAALLTLGSAAADAGSSLAGLYYYPNPFSSGQLKLGGIDVEVAIVGGLEQGGAVVEIFNLEGQLIFRDQHVATETGFWDGRNRLGDPVASGLYLVRLSLNGETEVKTLAVVR